MNRSGYTDDCDEDEADEWECKLNDAMASPEGQAFLRELAAALDALPDKWLIEEQLVDEEGDCCAIGAVCKARGIDTAGMDNDLGCVAERLGVPLPLACEIVNENDDCRETPDVRWHRMRKWIERKIKKDGDK